MIAIVLALTLGQQKIETDAGCAKCHDKAQAEWKSSVHARNGIGCVACHGPDEVGTGDMPHAKNPETFLAGTKKTSHLVCAKCHEGVVKAFQHSSHWDDTQDEEGKVQSCLSCHVSHATVYADRQAILDKNCAKCHRENSAQRKIMTSYVAMALDLERKTDLLGKALEHPVPGVSRGAAVDAHEEAKRVLMESRREQHHADRGDYKNGGNFKGIELNLPAAAKDAEAARTALEAKLAEAKKRPLLLAGFLALVGLSWLVFRAKLIRWGHGA